MKQYHKQWKIRNAQQVQKVHEIHKGPVEAVGKMDDKDTILARTHINMVIEIFLTVSYIYFVL